MRWMIQLLFTILCLSTPASYSAEPPSTSTSPIALSTFNVLERGRYLARAGNCVACHTQQGAAEYSGGKAIDTPFGTVYSSNLTSDKASGLGSWSADDFWQALHHGKSRDGRNLYPAFPYPSYTLIIRDDSDAIFAYLQTIPAVSARPPAHELRFPFNTQFALSAWRQLFFKPGAFEVNAEQSDSWNQGAYLVKGLGHCGACHTPRGAFGNTLPDQELAGSYVDHLGWDALSLATGPLDSHENHELVTLLKSGVNERDQLSGPMADIAFHSLQHLNTEHLADMVEYMSSLPTTPTQLRSSVHTSEAAAKQLRKEGEEIYGEQCSDCHGENGQGEPFRYPALAANRGVTAESPNNAIRILKQGGFGASTARRPRPYGMPAYAHQLSAEEAAAVLSYIRAAWGNDASAVSPQDVWRD